MCGHARIPEVGARALKLSLLLHIINLVLCLLVHKSECHSSIFDATYFAFISFLFCINVTSPSVLPLLF